MRIGDSNDHKQGRPSLFPKRPISFLAKPLSIPQWFRKLSKLVKSIISLKVKRSHWIIYPAFGTAPRLAKPRK